MHQDSQSLPFPQSLYVPIQNLREEKVQDVCLGLFDQEPLTHYTAALQALVDLILETLPPPSQRILIVSAGLGSLATALERLGHNVEVLTTAWESVNLESLDVIVFHESIRHLNLVQLFGRAYQALVDGGVLLLLDEVNLDHYASGYDGRPCLGYLLPLAQRCGFIVSEQQDLSSHAALTLDYYLSAVQKHREHLLQRPESTEQTLDQFAQLLNQERCAYAQGQQGYHLLCFNKDKQLRWRVAPMDEQAFLAVAQLFQKAFGHPISRELWDWKYAQGRGQGVIAWAGDQVVAHYGGITRKILYRGQPALGCQISDVMVDPTERAVLTRKGPFFLTAASQSEVSRGKHLIGYGFPNARAMKMAVRLKLYQQVGEVAEIFWPPSQKRSLLTRLLLRIRRIDKTEEHGLDIIAAALWQSMSADLEDTIVGVRDSDWLRHRYLNHPQYDYHVLLLSSRLSGKPTGIFVLRQEGNRCELIDLLAPLAHFPKLIEAARAIAGLWGCEGLYGWISTSYAHNLTRCGGEQRELDVAIPTSIWTKDVDYKELQDRWWLMSGDTDFR